MVTSQATVLVVDDNQDAVDSLVELLRASGFQAIGAYNGREAIEIFQIAQPFVIFLDLSMPGMNGFEVLIRLRSMEGCKKVRIIALSGDTPRLQQRICDAGFDGSLSKPASLEEILKAVPFAPSNQFALSRDA